MPTHKTTQKNKIKCLFSATIIVILGLVKLKLNFYKKFLQSFACYTFSFAGSFATLCINKCETLRTFVEYIKLSYFICMCHFIF